MDSYKPMEINTEYPQQESPTPTLPSHDPIPSSSQHLQHSTSLETTQSPPSKYLRVAPEAHTALLLVTRTTPVLLASGHQIPLAQSCPTLVPCQTQLPATKRPWQKASSMHVMVQREEDEAICDALQSKSQPPQEDSLGLYDDPDAGDEVHRDPLLHTERHDEDLDAEVIPNVQVAPSNSQHAPVDQVYQDAHPDWFGHIIIIMVAILHAFFIPHSLFLQLSTLLFTALISMTILLFIHRLFKPVSNRLFRMVTGRKAQCPPPVCAAPIQVPSSSLVNFLAHGGNEAACESWRSHMVKPGELHDISDGEVWCTIQGPDQAPFFSGMETSQELHIGVTMSLDWFGRKTSIYGPSYSSGILLLCVSNLPRALSQSKYPHCRLLACLTPLLSTSFLPSPAGLFQITCAHLSHSTSLLFHFGIACRFPPDCLLPRLSTSLLFFAALYKEGVVYHTPGHPEGRRVRVVLLGVVCDHPAMCKMCGFADHSHKNSLCPKCKVTQDELFSDESLRNEFDPHNGEEHRCRCFQEKALETRDEHNTFFDKHGVHWTELARLPYFDLVRQTIIDSMHNLLLGIIKTQWYMQWILTPALCASTQTRTRELDLMHTFLSTFEAPLWAGKLLLRVGEPAGGSLTADEYKFAATTAWPITIPIIWDMFMEEAESDQKTSIKSFAKCQNQFIKDYKAWKAHQEAPQGSAGDRDAIANAESLIVKMLLECMLGDGHEASGTIQDAAAGTGFDELSPYLHVQPGPSIPNPQQLSNAARVALYTHYNSQQPHSVHYALKANPRPGSSQLNDFALYYQCMIELPLVPVEDDPWSEFPELDVMCFKLNKYWSPGKDGAPPTILPFNQITSQIAHGIIKTSNPELWITTTLDRHPTV
ncbi:uncharacterized protein F5891DRAFT_1179677 [Suillus fuscotomentosus]|uniref:Uncharacterized protein n=1 Tax=Suillus fuscotomentosus TaxID=1912939 RepID=A0AAD4HTA4_9AGAM|nr:uncharacterized protein F5891DRAFT_1179677 [Suillus fuscotomentosus]KAG1908158.1 hypothetical protein F5891DRAFT_1179677 [Suillus fuscotomentosus]